MSINRTAPILACLALLLATGCQSSSAPAGQTPAGIVETVPGTMLTVTPPGLEPTNPINWGTAETATPDITPTPQNNLITQNCLDVLPAAPAGFKSKGIIPLEDYQTQRTIFLNLETGDKAKIPAVEKRIDSYALSPDRKTLAYTRYATSDVSLTLTDALNSQKRVVLMGKADLGVYNWLNNQQLLVGKGGKWVIFNPYTKQEKGYSLDDFPDYDRDNIRDDWVTFDSTGTRAIYKYGDIFLTDMEIKKIIAHVTDGFDRTPVAAWAPDGSKAAIVGTTKVSITGDLLIGDDIFVVGRDGQQITQLTHLAKYYGAGFSIRSLSWSPDSRYIAVWMNYHKTKQDAFTWVLAVVDTATTAVTDYCIPTDPYASTDPFPLALAVPAPLWSPDGKQIIIEHRTDDSKYVVLVDITQNIAFQIAQNMSPLGWMMSDK